MTGEVTVAIMTRQLAVAGAYRCASSLVEAGYVLPTTGFVASATREMDEPPARTRRFGGLSRTERGPVECSAISSSISPEGVIEVSATKVSVSSVGGVTVVEKQLLPPLPAFVIRHI